MIERLPTGVEGLDEVLGSGLPANGINLIVGVPGSGKTLLAQQLMFQNATVETPALYLATVSEPFEKIIRYGQQLSFFDAEAVGQRVFYEDLGGVLQHPGGREDPRKRIGELERHNDDLRQQLEWSRRMLETQDRVLQRLGAPPTTAELPRSRSG